jgi:1,4-alpha-glucan branching enzyme
MNDIQPSPNQKAGKAGALSRFSDFDIYLFRQGSHFKLYEKFGAHLMAADDGTEGVYFAVWAPNAKTMSVTGDFNGWNSATNKLSCRADGSGIWEGFIPGLEAGTLYKFHVESSSNKYRANRGDPFAYYAEVPPQTSPIIWDINYQWQDAGWMRKRKNRNALTSPISIYEVHLGSWRRKSSGKDAWLNYREMAPLLAEYVNEQGFTHVEFLPIMEHPFYGSWGYQTTGYFAPTSRYGTPQDFMFLVDYLHQKNIGVILDWVPSHFPGDEHGLVYYDGTHLYEHADPREGFHPDWKSYIFNYGRAEVRSFLF